VTLNYHSRVAKLNSNVHGTLWMLDYDGRLNEILVTISQPLNDSGRPQMNTLGKRNLIVAALCFCVAFTSIAPLGVAQKKQAPVEATAPPVREGFKFGNVDLEVLEQVNLLDRRFEKDGLVLEDEAANAYLFRIGSSLIPQGLTLDNVTWKFRALRDPEPNAFALPNGSIYVTTGLLALVDNESQLAAIMAHELTHVMRRHTYMQNRSNRKKFLTMNVIAVIGSVTPGAAGAVITLASAIAPLIVMSTIYGYSRELERESDHRAIDMMIAAEWMRLFSFAVKGRN